MSDNYLIRGTAILTASIFISKLIGIMYIFPFQAMVGLEGLALYHYGYTPYTIFISLSTLGIPIAISKFISKYNALGDEQTIDRLFRSGLVVMSITGFVAFIALFLLAEPIAIQILDPEHIGENTIDDTVFTIRMVSTALIVVPVMSTIRGYFQGFGIMGPTAVSQVIEQIIRVIFILVFTYFILKIWNGQLSTAIGFASFGAFVGALGGLTILMVFLKKRKRVSSSDRESWLESQKMPFLKIYKELISYALPISFVGLAIPLYQLIDLVTFQKALIQIGYSAREAEMYFGAFGQAVHKLVLIPVSIATAMSITIIPLITKAFANKNLDKLKGQVTQIYQIILFFSIPAALGLVLLADEAYGTLYSLKDIPIGGGILQYYAPVAIFFSLFAVSTSILQGIHRPMFAVFSLVIGIACKAILNYPFILWFDAKGAIFATSLGYLMGISFCLWVIGRDTSYDFRLILNRFLKIGLSALIMGICVVLIRYGLGQMLPIVTKMNVVIILIISSICGLGVYMVVSIRLGIAGQVLGSRFTSIRKLIRKS